MLGFNLKTVLGILVRKSEVEARGALFFVPNNWLLQCKIENKNPFGFHSRTFTADQNGSVPEVLGRNFSRKRL